MQLWEPTFMGTHISNFRRPGGVRWHPSRRRVLIRSRFAISVGPILCPCSCRISGAFARAIAALTPRQQFSLEFLKRALLVLLRQARIRAHHLHLALDECSLCLLIAG